MNLEQTSLGYEIHTSQFTIFFGGQNSQITPLQQAYPHYKLVRVKQIHSDAIVETASADKDYQVIADAHFTKQKLLALCVVTADCMPIFFYDQKTGLAAGVHAGWRGVAARLVPKTIQTLVKLGAKTEHLGVVIGPHIQKQSFEVGFDVRDQILSSLGPISAEERNLYFENVPGSENKALVDLNHVVKSQLHQEGIDLEKVFSLHIDTATSSHFHSYRRDKDKAGRQISFICKTS